jgi:hypothetical protein
MFFLPKKKGGLAYFWFVIGERQLSYEKDDIWSSPGTLVMLPTWNISCVPWGRSILMLLGKGNLFP